MRQALEAWVRKEERLRLHRRLESLGSVAVKPPRQWPRNILVPTLWSSGLRSAEVARSFFAGIGG